jgi:hypothetical protein
MRELQMAAIKENPVFASYELILGARAGKPHTVA